ncbi:hypothetical protein ACM26W_01130 [Halomonas sp. HK25]|uniref:hypothetical protein n=1 Tax=Halomonas sp. HK25 TaxID=3394321 RepID=UPI0039FC3003
MHTVSALISTSVTDARISLAGMVESNPQHAGQLSLQLLERMKGWPGQSGRRMVALRTLRVAAKRIAEDCTPDSQGSSLSDIYYTLPIGDLRKVLAQPADPYARAGKVLTTLLQIRGEEGQATRRKILVAAIGKAAKTIQQADATPGDAE